MDYTLMLCGKDAFSFFLGFLLNLRGTVVEKGLNNLLKYFYSQQKIFRAKFLHV